MNDKRYNYKSGIRARGLLARLDTQNGGAFIDIAFVLAFIALIALIGVRSVGQGVSANMQTSASIVNPVGPVSIQEQESDEDSSDRGWLRGDYESTGGGTGYNPGKWGKGGGGITR